ncbi:sensor histidine kinase [sulfur-oxidizing endosymbiont of Gigantopelta aegis]|uniref:sensor histidine kinase n=1 Tax=sulfur-oxidizing endosymbiont of Gigantopelta aegis TaxID=2794934 RepID=UPI0018DC1294|nr:HAMP domain-containing sensor histidine kinase [sulfur-oxidizing endosymbiont of Gigantopelta aegis]
MENKNNSDYENVKTQVEQLSMELEEAKNTLLQQEYEAGIAELSVGVLHNIGNTLTPSKIAVSMLLQRLDKSPLRNHLRKILQPLEIAIPDCPLAEDEKQKLLKIIKVLPDGLEEEYAQNISDVENIRDKQEHIASIIALHMRYSHLKADLCDVNISRIIDDAISMQSESIKRRNIEVVKEIAEVPYLKIQESKLLQVLVNLLKNAYEAIDANPQSDKHILLKAYVEKQNVIITIKDSGLGFDPAMKARFFDFGYTSKKDGSGFGLHFCASFLTSIGGEIKATSVGEGKGAQFTIVLPV